MLVADQELTKGIISCAYTVHNTLGAGFLERVYENALALEIRAQGLRVEQQVPLAVRYRDEVVGEYFADLLLEEMIICELKAAEALSKNHEVQLVNYLVATGMDTGLLINFGESVTIRRQFRKYKKPVNPEKSC
ncbi:GxxExxY protein [Endothiovibrio diazotrophicus]